MIKTEDKGHCAGGFRAASRRLAGAALACGLIGAFALPAVAADTLEQALSKAYSTNPAVDAQRAALRATDEQVPEALSGYRPRVDATASSGVSRAVANRSSAFDDSASTLLTNQAQVALTQPLYQGGRTSANVRFAENQVQAQRAQLLSVEQQVLLNAATAYMDVVQYQAVLELTKNNEQVLQRQLEAAQDRFRVGEITRTDVSQSESRLARAMAERIQAEGNLRASRSAYRRIVGSDPDKPETPKLKFKLPATMDEAVELARTNNPDVVAAGFTERAARDQVDVVNADRLPQASVQAGVAYQYQNPWSATDGSSLDRTDTRSASLTARVTIPLYEGGGVSARVRGARQAASQRLVQVEEQRRQAIDAAVRAWQQLTTARASIESRQAQVRSAQIALEGVRQEALVGSRTILETLDAEQELLDANVLLVQAQRDEIVAAFSVLAAVGQLTARQLGLPVDYYDYEAYYKKVRDKWWGTSID